MGKASGLLLATLGFGTATYVMMAPDTERAATERLASLVRIAAEGTRTVAQSTGRSDRAGTHGPVRPLLIADQTAAGQNADQKAGQDIAAGSAAAPATKSRPLIIAQAVTPGYGGTDELPARRGSVKPVDDEAKRALSRSIQAELKRVGCFDGEADGAWNSATRSALKTFIERINATLPVNEPDYILLTLLQGHGNRVCGKACPAGQLLANDGRCQPKVIVAQADRRISRREVPPRDAAGPLTRDPDDARDNGARASVAQVLPTATERDRRSAFDAQLRAAEESRANMLAEAEQARRRAEQQSQSQAAAAADAKAEAARLAQIRAADAQRLKTEVAAEEARRRQLALDTQNRAQTEAKIEAQRLAQERLAEEQRVKTAALDEAQRRQLARREQLRLEQQRQADARWAEQERAKAAAAEEAHRRQLVLDQQQRSNAQSQRLAMALAIEDQRMQAAAAVEEMRRRQLVLDQQKSSAQGSQSVSARTPTVREPNAPAATVQRAPEKQAPNAPPVRANAPQTEANAQSETSAALPFASAVPAVGSVDTRSVPFLTGSVSPSPGAPATPALPVTIGLPDPVVPATVVPQPKKVARAAPRPSGNTDQAPGQTARFVQRFVPPSYVGRTNPAPAPAPRVVTYAPSAPSGRGAVFSNLSRNAP